MSILTDLSYTFTGRKANFLTNVAIGVGIIVFSTLLIGIIYLGSTCSKGNMSSFSEPEYLESLAQVVENMDSTIQPCDDFYTYACGGWIKRKVIPANKGEITVSKQIRSENEQKWRTILENPILENGWGSAERKMKDFFYLCQREYGRMDKGGNPFVADLLADLKGWYVTQPDTWGQRWNLTEATAKLFVNYGVKSLFRITWGQYRGQYNTTYLTVSKVCITNLEVIVVVILVVVVVVVLVVIVVVVVVVVVVEAVAVSVLLVIVAIAVITKLLEYGDMCGNITEFGSGDPPPL